MNGSNNIDMQEKIKSVKARIEKLIEAGYLDEAKAALQKYDSKMSGDPDICSMLAVIQIIEGMPEKAEEIILGGLKKDSVQFDLLYNLAYIREQKGLYEEALELYATAGTVARDGTQKQNIDEAFNRLKKVDHTLEAKDKARIVFFVKEGMDSFLGDIINGLSGEYRVRKMIVGDFSQIGEGMEWADVCWFEWCDELVVYGSRLPLAREKKLICRLHRYEVFTGVPQQVEWSNVDRLVIVARHLEDLLDMYHPGITDKVKIEVLENGVDLSRFSFKRRSNGFNLAMVGYIHSRKNPVLLLHIIRKLTDIDKRYKLYIAGQFQEQIIKLYWDYQVRRMGLESNIVFDGWQEDINRWLEDKNYVLSTSIHESFGYGIAEAMARGIKPIIHDFPYAFEIWDEELLFRTVDEAVDLIRNSKYESDKYRTVIENRYSLEKQVNHIKNMIEELVSYKKIINNVIHILSGEKKAEELMIDNLTVLIPCYNRAKMLKDDLDRGLKLGNQPKLIVDDSSTDNLDALDNIEKEFKRYNSRLIRKHENEGLAQTRRTGLQNIKTAFTAFVDDDDMLLCLNKEKAADDISKLNNDCVLIIPRYLINYNADGLSIGYDREIFNNCTAEEALVKIASTGEVMAMLAGGSIGITEVLRSYSSSKEFHVAEDNVMLSRMFANDRSKKVCTTDSLVHIRRISNQSLSKTLTPAKLALGLLAQAIACYYCLQLGVAVKEEVLKWMRDRAALIQRLYDFGENFEIELIAYLTGEINEEIFIRFITLHGLEIENGLDQLAPELRKMRAMFCNVPEPQKLYANVKAEELPQVSVIIPTFNRKGMLKRNIDHVLKQDYPNIEVVVSDNCSGDGTDEMVRNEYVNVKKVKYHRNEKNIGPTLNYHNAFYSLARGKYCLMLSDDDFLIDPLYISKAVKILESSRDVAFVFSGYYYNHELKRKAYRVLPDYPEVIDGLDFFINFANEKYNYMPNLCTVLFSRENAVNMNILKHNPDCLAGDLSILLRLLLSGSAAYIKNISLVYSLHKGSISLNPGNTVVGDLDSVQKVVECAVQDINELKNIYKLAADLMNIDDDTLQNWLQFRIRKYMYWRFNETVQTAEECRALVKFMMSEYPHLMQSLKDVAINRFGENIMDVR